MAVGRGLRMVGAGGIRVTIPVIPGAIAVGAATQAEEEAEEMAAGAVGTEAGFVGGGLGGRS